MCEFMWVIIYGILFRFILCRYLYKGKPLWSTLGHSTARTVRTHLPLEFASIWYPSTPTTILQTRKYHPDVLYSYVPCLHSQNRSGSINISHK